MITARAYRLIKFEFIYYEHKNTVIEICISQAFNKSNTALLVGTFLDLGLTEFNHKTNEVYILVNCLTECKFLN